MPQLLTFLSLCSYWLFEYNSHLCKGNDDYGNNEFYFKDMKFYNRDNEKRVPGEMLMQSKREAVRSLSPLTIHLLTEASVACES